MSSPAPTDSPPAGNSETETPEQKQLMEQYKAYLQTIDYSAENRLHTNQFFMTINSFLGTLFGYMVTSQKVSGEKWSLVFVFLLFVIAVVGFCVSRIWYLLLTHYTTKNSAKWDVIYDMEKHFPYQYQPFTAEWENKLKPKKAKMPNLLSWLWESQKKHPYYSYAIIVNQLPRLFGCMYIVLGLFTWICCLYSNWNDIVLAWEVIESMGLELVVEWAGFVAFIVLVLAIWPSSPNKR